MSEFYCPLVGLRLNPNIEFKKYDLDISYNIKIIMDKNLPSLSILSDELTEIKIYQFETQVHYWLCMSRDYSLNEIEEIVDIFLLALWIIKPTKLHVRFISNLSKDPTKLKWKKILSVFTYIPNHIKYEFDNDDIEKLKFIFPITIDLYKKKRFKNSLIFNYNGCVASYWEAAYILYVTTFESLLSYSESGVQLSNKLAFAYAIIIEDNNELRMKAFNKFKKMYKIRSKILHGYSFKLTSNENEKLATLANCRDMLRKLWLKILHSENLREIISKNDKARRKFFKKMSNGWRPIIELENIV